MSNENRGAEESMLEVPEFWDTNTEISGKGLDVANESSLAFSRRFRSMLEGLEKDKLIVCEIWGDASPWL